MFTQLWSRSGTPIRRGHRNEVPRKSVCRLNVEALEGRILLSGDMVLRWNEIMVSAVRTTGPVLFATRQAAIVEAAVYEAVNSIDRSYTPYLVDIPAPPFASKEAAAAEAAHDTLVGLFPAQAYVLDLELLASLQEIAPGEAKDWGIRVGHAAAQIMLAVRAHDGSDRVVDYTPGTNPGDWQPTPPAYGPPIAPQWPDVTPFGLQSASQFRPPPPPGLDSPEYAAAFDQVRTLGSRDSTVRTADQTEAALFWQGIVTPNAGATENWNQIAEEVAVAQGNTLVQNARMFALLNLAAADAGIACWDSKYHYNFWRPVTAIRYDTDPNWTPLMNTPSHPSYSSAHSSLGGASAAVLAAIFGDATPFSYSWVGLPGVTRSFDSFSAALQEVGMARIWAGFHWSFDVTAGTALGQSVGNYVLQHFLLPVGGSGSGGNSPSAPRAPVPGKAPPTVPAPADRSVASLARSPADAVFLVNGVVDGSGDRAQFATPSPGGSPTGGNRGGLNNVASGSQREFATTSDVGALGGHVGRAHFPGSGKSLDHGFRSMVAGEGGEDFWVGGLPEV